MAERLTSKNTVSVYNNSNSEIYLSKGEEATKYIYKLAQLEDIMEEYGIESVEELGKKLADGITWKRVCELACRHIAEVEWLSCPETDDISESENEIKTLTKQSLNYFYQQAKMEGNDERKN